VKDPATNPIAGTLVYYYNPYANPWPPGYTGGTTNASGQITFSLPPGHDLPFYAQKAGYSPSSPPTSWLWDGNPGPGPSNMDIVLTPLVNLTVQVRDEATNAPIPNVNVNQWGYGYRGRTDSSGNIAVNGLTPGSPITFEATPPSVSGYGGYMINS